MTTCSPHWIERFDAATRAAAIGDPFADVLYGPMLSPRFAERYESYLDWIGSHHRVLGSTAVGQLFDTGLFLSIAFLGIWPNDQLLNVFIAQYFFKLIWEAVLYPVTARLVAFLKRAEGADFYDRSTNFNPFTLKV